MKNKYSRSFEIALSAISCAVAVVCLLVGLWSNILLYSGYLLAMFALMVPLSKQFYWGGALAYLGTVVLAVVLGAVVQFWKLVPFIMFIGLHPLVNSLQLKFNINKWLALAVKTVWFDFSLWVAYILLFDITGTDNSIYEFIDRFRYLFIFVGGTLIFFPYDYLVFKTQITINKLVYRIKK